MPSLFKVRTLPLTFLLAGTLLSLRAAPAPDPLAALVRHVSEQRDEAVLLDVLRGMKSGLQGRRRVPMPDGWSVLEARLVRSTSEEVRMLAQGLGLTFGSETALGALRETLADRARPTAVRRTALEGLSSVRDARLPEMLRSLLEDPALRGDALRALAGTDDPANPAAILSRYASLGVGERRDALATLSSRLSYARPLVAALKSGSVPPAHLTADLVRQLRSLKEETINKDLEKLWGVTRETSADARAQIGRYRKIYAAGGSTPGDASRGRKVFSRICQQCHTLFDTGGKVGPDLTGSNRGDLDYILSNMVDPNAVIPNDYRSSTVETTEDRILTGIVKQQDEKSVTVVTATETVVLPRSEVKGIQLSELSMMPEGLLTPLSDQEVRDLIYYLGRPGQAP